MIEVNAWVFWGLFLFIMIILGLSIQRFVERHEDPDGILCINEEGDKIRANFIFCIPTGELLKKKHLKIDVQQMEVFRDDVDGIEGRSEETGL